MDDLPELPFEKVLSYLSLRDRLKARAVSRRWYHKINSFKVQTLCYSDRPRDFIRGKNRWISGAFAENFISSTRFESFFNTFGRSVLSNLKHLRFCDLSLDLENQTAFTRTLKSFVHLEQLDIIRAKCSKERQFKLTLPMLTSIHLDELSGVKKLILDAPRLRKVKILASFLLRLDLVHRESVERLLVDCPEYTEVKNLKNLKYLHTSYYASIDPTLLSILKQLKEFHTSGPGDARNLFNQKQRYGRADLKIYLCGVPLNGSDDPEEKPLLESSGYLDEVFSYLSKNPSRLADLIPACAQLSYSCIEHVVPEVAIEVLNRVTALSGICVDTPVRDIQHFLELLRNLRNLRNLDIVQLQFPCDQPQDLFDRLPEYSAVQCLTIRNAPSDLSFLFRLKHLISLNIHWPIDAEHVRKALELAFLTWFTFKRFDSYYRDHVTIRISPSSRSKQYRVSIAWTDETFSDANAAIEFIFGEKKPSEPKKRKNLSSKPPGV